MCRRGRAIGIFVLFFKSKLPLFLLTNPLGLCFFGAELSLALRASESLFLLVQEK
jgi:hypothetical protein